MTHVLKSKIYKNGLFSLITEADVKVEKPRKSENEKLQCLCSAVSWASGRLFSAVCQCYNEHQINWMKSNCTNLLFLFFLFFCFEWETTCQMIYFFYVSLTLLRVLKSCSKTGPLLNSLATENDNIFALNGELKKKRKREQKNKMHAHTYECGWTLAIAVFVIVCGSGGL